MRISIVVYDVSTLNRIKKNTYKYFSQYGHIDLNKDIIWMEGMYIEFRERLIILNLFSGSIAEQEIQQYLCTVLNNEEVAINTGGHIEYSKNYGITPKLTVTYMQGET